MSNNWFEELFINEANAALESQGSGGTFVVNVINYYDETADLDTYRVAETFDEILNACRNGKEVIARQQYIDDEFISIINWDIEEISTESIVFRNVRASNSGLYLISFSLQSDNTIYTINSGMSILGEWEA